MKALEEAISALDPGEFHFPKIYGIGWDDLYVGEKVRLGREFMNFVREGYFQEVTDTGKKKKGGRVYVKSG